MRIFRYLGGVMLVAFLVVLICGCRDDDDPLLVISSDTYIIKAGETLDVEELRRRYLTDTETEESAPPETTSPPETTAPPETTSTPETTAAAQMETPTVSDTPQTVTVYWVKSGEVWHISLDCPSLSRSKNILSGTAEEAMSAGKSRVCKRCGK